MCRVGGNGAPQKGPGSPWTGFPSVRGLCTSATYMSMAAQRPAALARNMGR